MQAFGDYTVISHHEFPESSLRVLRLEPGQEIPAHLHHRSAQSYLVLEGSVEVRTDAVYVRLDRGEAIRVATGQVHALRPAGGPVVVVSISVPPLSSADHIPATNGPQDGQH